MAAIQTHGKPWRRDGVWERINQALRIDLWAAVGRHYEPSAAVISTQSVKAAETGGGGSR
ncbi:MAG: hypothetical protein V4719_31190 [Planctomycetota bacterium]